MKAIFKREIKAYCYSPLGYVFVAVYFIFVGFFFYNYNLYGNTNDMRGLFDVLFTITLFLVPILTMRLLSEERKLKTDQLLLLAPVSSGQIVWGKFLAAAVVYLVGISGTLLAALVLQLINPPEWPVVWGHFIGLLLLGMALIAIGLLISSLTENQIIASVGGFAAGFFMMLMDNIAAMIPIKGLSELLRLISFRTRYQPFTLGLLATDNLVFFISIVLMFITLTGMVFERRRWA